MMRSRSSGEIGIQANGRNRRAIQDGVENGGRAIAAERELAGGHFIEHGAERKKIGARVEFLGTRLFGRHISDGADGAAWTGELCGVHALSGHCLGWGGAAAFKAYFGEAEVENFGVATVGDENICRLDVSMDDALGVRGIQCVGYIDGDGEKKIEFHRSAGDGVLQRLAFKALHGDEGLAIFLADVVNGANVGMIQRGGGLRFALETREGLRVFGDIFREEFEGDEAVQAGVFRFIDHAHAAPAKFFEDAVMGDSLTD